MSYAKIRPADGYYEYLTSQQRSQIRRDLKTAVFGDQTEFKTALRQQRRKYGITGKTVLRVLGQSL